MINVRCELCNDWLSLFQISKLCGTCYKIRAIVKCYTAEKILSKLEDEFLIVENDDLPPLFKASDRTLEDIQEERENDDKLQTSINEYGNKDKCLEELKNKVKGLKKKN